MGNLSVRGKCSSWKTWGALVFLGFCISLIYPTYNYIKRQIARNSLVEAGGNIRYQPEFVKLPKRLSSSDYRLPDTFSTSIDYLKIDSSIKNPDEIDHLGELAPRAVIEFSHPADFDPKIFHHWDGTDISASLSIIGQDDLVECFQELENSPFKTLTLLHHDLSANEAAQLVGMTNLKTLILKNVTMELEAVTILKTANIPYVAYLSTAHSNATVQVEQATQFLKEYGSVDVHHWNYLPKKVFYHHQHILVEQADHAEKHLAFDISNQKLKKTAAIEILNSQNMNGTQLLCFDLTTQPGEFESVLYNPNNWPKSNRNAIKAIQIKRMNTGSHYFDLKRLIPFNNLEHFAYPHRQELRNWETLSAHPSLKALTVQNLSLTNFAQNLLNCQSLHTLDTPHGIIRYKHLERLLSKDSMQAIICIPKIDQSNSTIKEELTKLCNTHGWSIKNIEDKVRFTLVRNTISKPNQ